ncbi:DUF5625 family protein [Pseudomonas sp. Au-Pse12]|uniref:DUF5625 family protein n=1 Tax=Pseudomonas sp. Au-Pse12 TaxID=2906459 RepID=UPI001E2F2CB5|nr:DUF5625 family protein [Pseudomonas sp. Au-Pse12]MCE4052358.1 DUF5625 family protein [Pseudomonas sp. Au-Pse12]
MNNVVLGLVKKIQQVVVLLCCVLLVACTEPLSIIKPLDVSKVDQVVSSEFEVKKAEGYRAALNFIIERGEFGAVGQLSQEQEDELWGNSNKPGTLIPVKFKLLRDGEVFFDQEIVTDGICCYQRYEHEGEMFIARVRVVWFFFLQPGKYQLELRTLEGFEKFRGIETYMEFSRFSPKH